MVEALPDIAFVIRPDGIAEHYNKQMRDYVGGADRPGPRRTARRCTRRRTASGSTGRAPRPSPAGDGIHRRGAHAAA